MRKLTSIVFVLAVVFGLMGAALAQTQITSGVIQGTVTDPSGAVVAGANVEIRNTATNFTKSLVTDSNGRYVGLLLPSGDYEVTISKQGFGKLLQKNVSLNVGQAVTLSSSLKVAGTTTQVEVTATPTLDPTKTESSSTLNDRSVSRTPVLGRKFEDLLTLTPGVSVVQGPDGDEINFNGQRGIFNNVSLDGGDYNNGFFGEQAGGQRAAIDITMEAVKEFQVIASGASPEFGRTAGGVVNVISKSGTNNTHGDIFYFLRNEALSSDTSDGKPLKDFNRHQFGATLGGPIKKDKMFYFLAVEQITANLQRDNLSAQVGPTACPIQAPTIVANEALINSNADCQRLSLLNYYQTSLNSPEGKPVRHPTHNTAILGKWDWLINNKNQVNASYNFDLSRKINETFDVATYGNSANGIEGTAKINAVNLNLVSTLTNNLINEGHITFSREDRPRAAVKSPVPADTAMGFATSFRFGNPFFLAPTVDETFKRFQLSDKLSWIHGKHNVKMGGEWLHSNNTQVFRGFFEGRYIFDSVTGFLRYSSPAGPGGFGPNTVGCWNGTYVTLPTACPVNPTPGASATSGGPLLLYLQGAGRTGLATDATGASDINNEDFALFIQDKYQWRPNFVLNYGLRWEAQKFPDVITPPSQTAYAQFLSDPRFPSNGKLPSQWKEFQPRVGFAWDIRSNAKSILRASWGIYNGRQNMLSQVGSITTNGVQQQTLFASTDNIRLGFTAAPVYPTVLTPAPLPPGTFPLFSGVRVFDRNYHNPRIYTTNVAFEQEAAKDYVVYVDFTYSKGVYLTNFLDYNRADRGGIFGLALGETMVTSSRANSLYRGVVFGLKKRYSDHFQMDVNYTYSTDYDNDSNERDPFTDRSGPATPAVPFNLRQDYGPSDRDIRHKFNMALIGDLPWKIQGSLRIQARSAQPITPSPRFVGGTDLGRNSLRKDNVYTSADWRLARPFTFGDRYALTPSVEMFNTFNSANNVNPLVAPALFNFDGYLRNGVGDPRQVQFALKFTF